MEAQVRMQHKLVTQVIRNTYSISKLGAISSQRRRVVERGGSGLAGGDIPDTNRAVGGSDRM